MPKKPDKFVEVTTPPPVQPSKKPRKGKAKPPGTVLRLESHQASEDAVREVAHLPIPATTVARKKLKYELCARAYIYGVVETINQAAKLSGIAFQTAQSLRESDRWDDFAAQVQSNAVRAAASADDKGRLNLTLAPDQKSSIVAEFKRQFESIGPLTEELERNLRTLNALDPESADYARVIKNVTALRAEVEHVAGVARYRAAQGKLDAAEISSNFSSPEAAQKAESNKGLDSLFAESLQK